MNSPAIKSKKKKKKKKSKGDQAATVKSEKGKARKQVDEMSVGELEKAIREITKE